MITLSWELLFQILNTVLFIFILFIAYKVICRISNFLCKLAETCRKTFIICTLVICFICGGLLSISHATNISNPFIVIRGMFRLEVYHTKIEEISEDPLILIGKENVDIVSYLKDLGYTFEKKEGNGFFLKKEDEVIYIKPDKFTKKFIIWRLSEVE